MRSPAPMPRGLLTLAVLGLTASTVLAGCASGTTSPAASATPTPTTSTPTPEPPTTLLSGRVGHDHPVLAVKIDNTVHSHPQAGLMAADLVYVEEVEWSLTRLVAVFSSRYPKVVGPVRSARVTDIDLLAQFGRPAFAYAGANTRLKPHLAAAPFYRVSSDLGPGGYWRDERRAAPWNLFASPKLLLDRAPRAQRPHDIGFTFSDEPPAGGTRVHSVTAEWPYSTMRFRWDRHEGRWLVTADGEADMSAEGPRLGGSTVIVQQVDVYPTQYGDRYGGVTPMSETVGRGKALVLRNGRAYRVTWSRPSAQQGTTWTYRGHDFPMAPGQVWIVLLDDQRQPALN